MTSHIGLSKKQKNMEIGIRLGINLRNKQPSNKRREECPFKDRHNKPPSVCLLNYNAIKYKGKNGKGCYFLMFRVQSVYRNGYLRSN
jgi:hypothetical protein